MTAVDWDHVAEKLEQQLEGLDGSDLQAGRRAAADVLADWQREADSQDDPAAVHRFQREDLTAQLTGQDAAGRLEVLRRRAIGRKVDRLNVRALALGRRVLDGEDGEAEGRALLTAAEELAPEVAALAGSPEKAAIKRDLDEAVMDALYAVERKAMSHRLAREEAG
jgi:hypothetical protein